MDPKLKPSSKWPEFFNPKQDFHILPGLGSIGFIHRV